MLVGLISDTHGSESAVTAAAKTAPDVKLWLHAGDLVRDAEYLEELTDTGVVKVAGNCDWSDEAPEALVVEAEGTKIFLTHGHLYGVKSDTEILKEAARKEGATIAVYGHTHVAYIEKGDVLVLNPGSAARPRDDIRPSFMLLDLERGKAPQVKLIRME